MSISVFVENFLKLLIFEKLSELSHFVYSTYHVSQRKKKIKNKIKILNCKDGNSFPSLHLTLNNSILRVRGIKKNIL